MFRRQKPAPSESIVTRRVRELEIITARLIRAGFAGEYHAAFHGRGIEFAQVREYQPGDDIRTIDWNVTARSGVPHVKEFVEERDLTVMLVLDVSRSMSFGSVDKRKSDLAAELVAVLAFAAVQNRDRVGLLTFGEQIHSFLPPRRGRVHVQSLVRRAIEAERPQSGGTALDGVVRFLERVLIKRSVVIFVSDFLDFAFDRQLERLNQRHDVIAMTITDPREEHFPTTRALVSLTDGETGQRVTIDLARNDVRRRAEVRSRRASELLRKSGIDSVMLSTAVPYDRALMRFFEQRIARRRR
ncbi:MAG TPA: DUF58 domain-containing protein [Thermoanaerobaculia bacterium]|nr:DUF58 domain-containing protein [Thermoanaerobaculia bacterium]